MSKRAVMASIEIETRVRPPRVCTLLKYGATFDDLNLVTRFYSRLWGGRFNTILVEECENDSQVNEHLALWRPDYVYSIGIDNERLAEVCRSTCQPRGCSQLTENFVDTFFKNGHAAGLIHHHRVASWLISDGRERYGAKYKAVGCNEASNLYPLTQAFFGYFEPVIFANLPKEPLTRFDDSNAIAPFFEELKVFSTSTWQTWLDFMSHGLNTFISGGFPPPATLVLIQSVQDLAHFWNLRTATEPAMPASVLPIPFFEGNSNQLINEIADLLAVTYPGFLGGNRAAALVSRSVPTDQLNDLTEQINLRLAQLDSPQISNVNAAQNSPQCIIVPYDSTLSITGDIQDRHLKWFPPQPRMHEYLADSDNWFVDLLKDHSTRRAVAQLDPVRSQAVVDVLNAPSPKSAKMYSVPTAGIGFDSINYRCSKNSGRRSDCLPAAEELIHTILYDSAFTIVSDEKRTAYETALGQFPGKSFRYAAELLSGKRGEILRLLATENRTLDQIQSKLRLGNGRLEETVRPVGFNRHLNSLPQHAARVSQARLKKWQDEKYPVDNKLKSLLELWADKQFVDRIWKIGPCKSCNNLFWERDFSLATHERCPACGSRFEFNSKMPYGYELNPALAHAIREGAPPVFQTARFLDNLCNRGFQWLPGVKYSRDGQGGDIDLAAICDGQFVLCECKELFDAELDAGVWQKVERQVIELVRVGIQLSATLVVLATRSNDIPVELKRNAFQTANGKLTVAFLTLNELEDGWYRHDGQPVHSLERFIQHCPTAFDQADPSQSE